MTKAIDEEIRKQLRLLIRHLPDTAAHISNQAEHTNELKTAYDKLGAVNGGIYHRLFHAKGSTGKYPWE
jgi:hypothetical protein